MLFDIHNPKNLEFLINAAQILHIKYIILFYLFLIMALIYLGKSIKFDDKIKLLIYCTLFIGIGALINGVAVIAVTNLNKQNCDLTP